MPDRAFEKMEEGRTVEETGQQIMGKLQSVASNEKQIVSILDWTQKKLVGLGGWFKILVLIPCYAFVIFTIVLVVLFMVCAWFAIGYIEPKTETNTLLHSDSFKHMFF